MRQMHTTRNKMRVSDGDDSNGKPVIGLRR